MKKVFAPGCALYLYKPQLAERMLDYLLNNDICSGELITCCRHAPKLTEGDLIINTCPGCDRRYRQLYEGVSTTSLWEELLKDEKFPFPDYNGLRMSITDACPTRDQGRVHKAVRALAQKMNIQIVEPLNSMGRSKCCGDSYYGVLPVEKVKEKMAERAAEMTEENILVYCLSCSKSMYIGGRKPRYLLDLLFGEDTIPGVYEPEAWHKQIDDFIETH